MQLASLTHNRSWGGTLFHCEAFERLVTKASVKSVHGHLMVLGWSAANCRWDQSNSSEISGQLGTLNLRAFWAFKSFFLHHFTKQVKGLNHYQVTGLDLTGISMFVQASVKSNSFLSSLVSCSLYLCPCIDSSDILKYSSCCKRRQVLSTGLQTLWMWIHNNWVSRFKSRFSNYSFLLWTHLFFHLHLILVKKEFLLKFMECQYSCTIAFLVMFYFTLHSIQTPKPIYICSDSWPLNAPLHCRSCAPYDNLVVSIGSCAPYDNLVISIGSCAPYDNSVPILLLFWSTPPLLLFKQYLVIWLDAKLLCITKSSILITPWKSQGTCTISSTNRVISPSRLHCCNYTMDCKFSKPIRDWTLQKLTRHQALW
jgi:hypothetical protein